MGKKVSYVFIRDPDFAWRPAIQEGTQGGKAVVNVPQYRDEQAMMSDGGRSAKTGVQGTVNLKDYHAEVLPLQNVDSNGNCMDFPDMVKLPYLHEVRTRVRRISVNTKNSLRPPSHTIPSALFLLHLGWYSVQPEKASHCRKALHSHRGYCDCCQPLPVVH